jgi:alanyl-tRNA synthetase
LIAKAKSTGSSTITGKSAFELYDTYGFPLDLTELILREQSMEVDKAEFDAEMQQQKSRSRTDAAVETDDWVVVNHEETAEFVGYDTTEAKVKITRYRKVASKGKNFYHLIFNKTPFYAESGGQVGDIGVLKSSTETIQIVDTKKENNLSIHITDKLPAVLDGSFEAIVNVSKRLDTESNHSATHLLHQALREILGKHVEQKGSLVNPDYLRFDFSHFQKLTDEEIEKVENFVNERIRRNINLDENRAVEFNDAVKLGAMALFGEKYGSQVRVIRFADSVELCGGTHVKSTGQIGYFKIISESAIAAGIRRIEAISGSKFTEYLKKQETLITQIKEALKNPQDVLKSLDSMMADFAVMTKKIEEFEKIKIDAVKKELLGNIKKVNNINVIAAKVELSSANAIKDLAFQLKGQVDNLFMVIGAEFDGKANLAVAISDNLVKEKNINASNIIREIAKEIDGGGGGQPFFATAGGKKPEGIDKAIAKALMFIEKS